MRTNVFIGLGAAIRRDCTTTPMVNVCSADKTDVRTTNRNGNAQSPPSLNKPKADLGNLAVGYLMNATKTIIQTQYAYNAKRGAPANFTPPDALVDLAS